MNPEYQCTSCSTPSLSSGTASPRSDSKRARHASGSSRIERRPSSRSTSRSKRSMTYNLHVMLRFDLEVDLLEGRLSIRELPEAWRARFESDLGLAVPDDKDGVLQDVHWYSGFIGGAFQGYTLGNVLGAQFYAAACRAHPDIPQRIANGDFATLHGWLRENVYRHGAKFTASELVQRATGGPMSIEPYLAYLWDKYQPLYDLESVAAAR